MKKLVVIAMLLLAVSTVLAQNADLRRKIEVEGIVEKEVTPDIINVNISLKEYMDGKTKISIGDLESQLEKAVTEAGIPKEDFTINNLSAYNYSYQKKKNPDFLASKQYGIRFRNLNKYNDILSKLDPKAIQSTSVESYDYSKMPELKKELKTAALLAAKEKATYLLAALGEKPGSPLSIVENPEDGFVAQANLRTLYANNVQQYDGDTTESNVDVKRMKLRFSVHAVFEIVK